ncbi:MAG: acyl-CoA dehydrogenase [Sphingomonadaceae bacterium]|nr:acyl-CoA dehydrogenase [Sphingomonadaceae bacterium]
MSDNGLAPETDDILRAVGRVLPDRAVARAIADGKDGGGEAVAALAELGIFAMTVSEAHCGAGLGLADLCAVIEELARNVAPAPFLATGLAACVLDRGEGEGAARLRDALLGGAADVGVVLPASGRSSLVVASADGRTLLDGAIEQALDATGLEVLLVPGDGAWWAVRRGEGVTVSALESFDPTRPLATVTLSHAPADRISDMPLDDVEAVAWTLIAADAIGAAREALDLTSAYALDRTQFGQPIGRFQAIKHKLTDALVAIEGARSALTGALRSGADGIPTTRTARMAKATATAAAAAVLADAVQIHGAIGNTWEHDLHLLMRRAKFCQLVLGSPDAHLDRITDDLVAHAGAKRERSRELDFGFRLDAEDQRFADEFRQWLDENFTPDVKASFRGSDGRRARRDWQAMLADGGWAGIHWPKAFGGRDASFTQQVIYHSMLARRGGAPLIGNRGLSLTGPTIIAHGTEAQKARFVEATRCADILWASGLSERGAGSDLASLSTRGVVDGDELVITGHKIWTTSAQYADWLFALIRTGPLHPKHEGISCVLIPLDAERLEIRPIKRMSGDHDFNELFFDEVRVPLANVVGAIDNGWKVARTTLSHEHLTNFLGQQLAQARVVDRVIGWLAEQDNVGGLADPGLRKRVGQAWVNSQLLRLHGLRNVARMVAGEDPGAEGSIQKLFGQEEDKRLFELALDIQGAGGLTATSWANAYLSTRASTIGGGTSEVHRNKIAERVLGMPRDLWASD